MTNAELAAAIDRAHWLTRNTAKCEESYWRVVNHLAALLTEQERRATEVSMPPRYTLVPR